jgi:hypothetical protein
MKTIKFQGRYYPASMQPWLTAADAWTPDNDTLNPKPGGVKCAQCWDTGVCAECLGQYPHQCPGLCGDGRCHCQTGIGNGEQV